MYIEKKRGFWKSFIPPKKEEWKRFYDGDEPYGWDADDEANYQKELEDMFSKFQEGDGWNDF